jgi:hypothetical protein
MSRWWRRFITVIGCIVVASVAVLTAPSNGSLAPVDSSLQKLMHMSVDQRAKYLNKHPADTVEFLNATPQLTADWWNTQKTWKRRDAITVLPKYVGNLEGIDYESRDIANRKHLSKAITKAQAAVKAHPDDPMNQKVLRSYLAIKSAANSGRRTTPRRYLTYLTDDRPPLAAISVGDLDTAEQVTFNVPGMGTYTDDMQAWTQSAQNVWEAQGEVGAPSQRAVVAWIGYVTPPVGIDAALGLYATQGAGKLITALEGFRAARDSTVPITLNVVAHSYGTTTAADALADVDVGVYAFVMLGSAGVENRIQTAGALHAKYVYAGEAALDEEARWGRVTRHDPRAPAFGARVLSVDGDAALGLRPVTGHAPVLHSKWNDNPLSPIWTRIKDNAEFLKEFSQHKNTFGYLDNGTESLQNTAIATTPHANTKMTTGE